MRLLQKKVACSVCWGGDHRACNPAKAKLTLLATGMPAWLIARWVRVSCTIETSKLGCMILFVCFSPLSCPRVITRKKPLKTPPSTQLDQAFFETKSKADLIPQFLS
jgi:hypothetical protein